MSVDILVGLQWGDEGKGKIIDILCPSYDIIARFQGGPNAGHTLVIQGKKYVFHTLPSGIIHPNSLNVLGSGMVIDPVILKKEIDMVCAENINIDNRIIISRNAHLILPSHRMLDSIYEEHKGNKKIGSTLKGIGPSYQDKIARVGLRLGDIFNKNFKDDYKRIKQIHFNLLNEERRIQIEEEESKWFEAIDFISSLKIINTEQYLNDQLTKGVKILAEGAQGTLLDINYGTYPYVTSSTTISAGACTGLGIPPTKIKHIYGVFKAYTTRVGEGPFITEQNNEIGQLLMKEGFEYGSTTGRERRCGWLDLVALQYAIIINGVNKLIITKSDVLSCLDTISICTKYVDSSDNEISYADHKEDSLPFYRQFPGWKEKISGIDTYEKLPSELKAYLRYIETKLGKEIWMISTGADRNQTLIK